MFQSVFEGLVDAVWIRREQPCPTCHDVQGEGPCRRCGTRGHIPDRYGIAAWDVLTYECPDWSTHSAIVLAGSMRECPTCHGRNRIAWQVENPPMPTGAIRGMLREAMHAGQYSIDRPPRDDEGKWWLYKTYDSVLMADLVRTVQENKREDMGWY